MKKAKVEATEPVKTRKKGGWITTQLVDKEILVLNIYENRILKARHCINIDTGEYATLQGKIWSTTKIERALGEKYKPGYYYYDYSKVEKRARMSKEDEEYIQNNIVLNYSYAYSPIQIISKKEMEYARERRDKAEDRRFKKVKETMNKVPYIPEGIKEWIDLKETGGMDYMINDRDTGMWSCSACGEEYSEKEILTEQGKRPKNLEMVTCPHCGHKIQILTRKMGVKITTHFTLIQPIDDEMSVTRHFKAFIECTPGRRKAIGIEEELRIILLKNAAEQRKKNCSIYYEQSIYPEWVPNGGHHEGFFDNKGNPSNKKAYTGYLYDDGIEEAFRDTAYEPWTRLFGQMAAADIKANYNRLMVTKNDENLMRLVEMLFKGRFLKLLQETSEDISYWSEAYVGPLKLSGNCIEDVFDIGDRQKINRIRDKDGDEMMLDWMRWSDEQNTKISDKALNWLMKNKLRVNETASSLCRMSPEKLMNYINRQKKEQYSNLSIKEIISQYEDYINMCGRLHRDLTDEMVYKPRELKRRHDEAVAEIERLGEQLIAEEYSERFGEAEQVLNKIKHKYEYAGDTFFIKVPEKIVEIVREGNSLHHCVCTTDRYFDRIKSHETYICFLRKVEEPDVPFYTIEVEPGGTIRQHRGMYDEEPELDSVKPFLKEWQKVIKKRMSKKDHERAAVSKTKREKNIAELKEKNNTRVLQGLEEDFMEAI